jgi:hypothetical protein
MKSHKEIPEYIYKVKYRVYNVVTVKCSYLIELGYTLLGVEDL